MTRRVAVAATHARRTDRGPARVTPAAVGATAGAETWIALSAADVALARRPIADITIQNQVSGCILGLRRIADRMLAEVDVGAPILAEVTVKAVRDLDLNAGDTIYCLFKARAWQYLEAR